MAEEPTITDALYSAVRPIPMDVIYALRSKGTEASHVAAHGLMEYFCNTLFHKESLIGHGQDVTIAYIEQVRANIMDKAQKFAQDHTRYLVGYALEKIGGGLPGTVSDSPKFRR